MAGGILNDAYDRFDRYGPEWGEHELTNHGPMAVEVLVRRGHASMVDKWSDRYVRRLDELPTATEVITAKNWRAALGDGRRIADWTDFFDRELREQHWQDVLATWWSRLLPGVIAGTTHGVIRVGHVVRALLTGTQSAQATKELACGLAFWAARMRPAPSGEPPTGRLSATEALQAIPRLQVQEGTVATRLSMLPQLPGWPESVGSLRTASDPAEARTRLTDLVTAATTAYLRYGHGSPVLLVHTATAPNAVLHTLPALPPELWAPSLRAIWSVTAAIFSAYAPTQAALQSELPAVPQGRDPGEEIIERAIAHGDEHVIKFADTAAEVHTRTGDRRALAAALRIHNLIPTN